jgi:hypothetical protein
VDKIISVLLSILTLFSFGTGIVSNVIFLPDKNELDKILSTRQKNIQDNIFITIILAVCLSLVTIVLGVGLSEFLVLPKKVYKLIVSIIFILILISVIYFLFKCNNKNNKSEFKSDNWIIFYYISVILFLISISSSISVQTNKLAWQMFITIWVINIFFCFFFMFFFVILSSIYRKNINRSIYKMKRIEEVDKQLKRLVFVYSIDDNRQALTFRRCLNDDGKLKQSPYFIYYIKENILIRYDKTIDQTDTKKLSQ